MNDADLKLIDQYKWLIPEERIPLAQVIEKIKAKFNAVQMESGDIPLLWMHKFNAVHLPRNEELGLTEAQLKIQAIRIPISRQTRPYVEKNFVPVHSGNGSFVYLAYEEQVGYKYSNSNRLFLEAQLMQGIPVDTSEASEEMMDFRHYLKSYHELYGMI